LLELKVKKRKEIGLVGNTPYKEWGKINNILADKERELM